MFVAIENVGFLAGAKAHVMYFAAIVKMGVLSCKTFWWKSGEVTFKIEIPEELTPASRSERESYHPLLLKNLVFF